MIKRLSRKNLLTSKIKNENGGISFILIMSLLVIFIIIPVFAVVVEKYIVQLKVFDIKEAIELSSISTYNTVSSESLSGVEVDYDNTKAKSVFENYLAKNLNINSDLSPKGSGIVEGTVTVDSFVIYSSGFPHTCPNGNNITRPSVHAKITVPIKPTIYKYTILQALGTDTINLKFHYDTEIVIDN